MLDLFGYEYGWTVPQVMGLPARDVWRLSDALIERRKRSMPEEH